MNTKDRWERFLSHNRLGKKAGQESTTTEGRSAFQRDFDRIVFSSAFRRLQDKTQVVPFAKSDYVRTRLTHSMEASCVGRSLGLAIGINLQKSLPNNITPPNLGEIVAAACLGHDIGNPPFGHSGEAAIQAYFLGQHGSKHISQLSSKEKSDFEKFNGNAQGFRVLTRLQYPSNPGGLQLSFATLGAFTKYPNDSTGETRKFGYLQSEAGLFNEMATALQLVEKVTGAYSRHPLAFLVEAADDICYHIMDFEDAFRLRHVTFDEVLDLFKAVTEQDVGTLGSKNKDEQVGFLRAKAIDKIVSQVAARFVEKEKEILSGELEGNLTDGIKCSQELKQIKTLSQKKYYAAREVLEIEIPAFDVLSGLLDEFILAANEVSEKEHASTKSDKLLTLLRPQFLGKNGEPDKDRYQRVLQITDFVSGMSDSYAVSLYRLIKGLSLPGV